MLIQMELYGSRNRGEAMSYFVMKKSGNQNKSIELKTSIPPKPYMAVKHSGTVGYIPLTTETSGAGIKIKNNGKNYKVVETYTTSINSSSTYNSYYNTTSTGYYTQTTGTNYIQCDSFTIVSSRFYTEPTDYDDEFPRSLQSIQLSLSVKKLKSYLSIYYYNNLITKTSFKSTMSYLLTSSSKYDIVNKINNQSLCSLLKTIMSSTILYANDLEGNENVFRYVVKVSTLAMQYLANGTYVNGASRTGRLDSASFLTEEYTGPEQYQTYSKATSYYTVSTTSQ